MSWQSKYSCLEIHLIYADKRMLTEEKQFNDENFVNVIDGMKLVDDC